MRCSIFAFEIDFDLEVFSRNLEVCLRMVANGAYVRSLRAYDDVAAITALPYLDLALLKHSGSFDVVQQCAVTLLMMLLDCANLTELFSELGEALFFSRLGELIVHVGPLEVLAIGCSVVPMPSSSRNHILAWYCSFAEVLRKISAICS